MTGDKPFRKLTDNSWDPAARVADMDQLGIAVQALSPPPVMFCYWADPTAAAAFARMQNENIASIVVRHPQRFLGMATLPMQDIDLAIAELRHARERLDLRAAEIGTCPGGRDLDHPDLFRFFEACRDLDVAVLVHPAAPLLGKERLEAYYFPTVVGNPLETAFAISRLIVGGVIARLPALRLCFAHGGGAFPYTLGRLERGWKTRAEINTAISESPRHYARKLFIDTLTHDPALLRFLVEQGWGSQLVVGSDYPYKLGDEDPRATLDAAGLNPEIRRAIESENARRFLGLAAS